jgi:hypothetical protein
MVIGILQSFTDRTVTSCSGVPECPLLVVLAQVLEVSRWNILTFSPGAVSVCEEVCAIVRSVMKTFLGTKATEGTSPCNCVQQNYDLIYPI